MTCVNLVDREGAIIMKDRTAGWIAIFASLLLGGCMAQGGPGEDPITRRFIWASYVNGEDLRQACQAGQEGYRFVYNGQYQHQLRTYDLVLTARGADWDARVFNAVGSILLDQAGWKEWAQGRRDQHSLNPADMASLDRAWAQTGPGAPAGQSLYSDRFYWIGMRCRNGAFEWRAWRGDDHALLKLPLAEWIMAQDRTGAEWRLPYDQPPSDPFRARRDGELFFEIDLGPNGITGLR